MSLNAFTELIQSIAAVAAVVRLMALGLGRRFPALCAYLIFIAISYFCFSILNPRSFSYFWVYITSIPLECVLSFFAVRELLILTFRNYPGIRTVGRWTMYVGIGVSVFVSLMLTRIFWNVGAHGRVKWGIFYFEVTQRSIVFSLAAVIIAIVFVLSKYPLHLSRNTYISCAFFSAVFLCEAARLFIDTLTNGLYNHFADWTEDFLVAGCLLTWTVMLRKEVAPLGPPDSTGTPDPEEDRLLQQLNSLNDLMGRSGRR